MIETIKSNKLEGAQLLAFSILCDCRGDWDEVEAFFRRPEIIAQGGWERVQTSMNSRRGTLDELFLEAEARLARLSAAMHSQVGCG